MHVDLKERVALVTGAGQGIGQAIASSFAANGARVIFSDRRLETATAAAARWPGCAAMELDVTQDQQVDDVLHRVKDRFGRLDILVNNAGVNTLEYRVPIDEFPREEWDRLLAVDLTGLYVTSKAAARIMRSQQAGRMINIASVAGLVPLRLQSPFVAAKAGVVNLTRSMALELGPHGILVNAIAPGSTLTEGTKQLFYGEDGKFRDSVQRLLDHIPLGRPGSVEEIAHAALFLAAPESSYINGHVLVVDGGWTAGYTRDF
ncbi:MAG: glucose 1-dehydrogenase [Planctomycetaceae bacterium]|nr:glucose 1-dehydrogenase [Planctomycetaceae bacterium]